MFSKACEYGIRAAAYIASQSRENRKVSLTEISEEIGSPPAFTGKILQRLSRNNIIDSVKGAHGGYRISLSNMEKVKLVQIVEAIEGDNVFTGCGLGLKDCNADKPCPVHDRFVDIRESLRQMLESTSLSEMTLGLDKGITYLKC